MTDTNTNWVVMKVTNRPSKYGNMMQEITFANSHWEIAHTYIDEDNKNYQQWQDIINGYEQGYGIMVSGLRYKKNSTHKKTGEPLVNADSRVKIVHVEEDRDFLFNEFVFALED